MVDFGQVKEIGPPFRFVFGQMTRALLADDDSAARPDLPRPRLPHEAGHRRGLRGPRQRLRRRHREADDRDANAGWADPDMFQDSYRDVLRILRANPLIKIPPDLLFVGRVMGLLNGLSMTLRSRTNLLVEMARLLDQQHAALKSAGNGGMEPTRSLKAGN